MTREKDTCGEGVLVVLQHKAAPHKLQEARDVPEGAPDQRGP